MRQSGGVQQWKHSIMIDQRDNWRLNTNPTITTTTTTSQYNGHNPMLQRANNTLPQRVESPPKLVWPYAVTGTDVQRQLPFSSHWAMAQSVSRSFSHPQQHHPQTGGTQVVDDQYLLAGRSGGLNAYLPFCPNGSAAYFGTYVSPDTFCPPSSLTANSSSVSSAGETSTNGTCNNCQHCNSHGGTFQPTGSLGCLANCRNKQQQQQQQLPSNQEVTCSMLSITVPLWRFLLDLLMDKDCKSIIAWTGRSWEFRFIDKHEVARLWGLRKNKPAMNYEKLSRGLRYYYDKNIIQKTPDKRFTYYYVCDMKYIVGKTSQQVHTELGTAPDTEEESDWAIM